jgi:hypothetical protein
MRLTNVFSHVKADLGAQSGDYVT